MWVCVCEGTGREDEQFLSVSSVPVGQKQKSEKYICGRKQEKEEVEKEKKKRLRNSIARSDGCNHRCTFPNTRPRWPLSEIAVYWQLERRPETSIKGVRNSGVQGRDTKVKRGRREALKRTWHQNLHQRRGDHSRDRQGKKKKKKKTRMINNNGNNNTRGR